ncbi:MAG: precorrin-2 C(20)-methyltransferase [Methanobacteriota archaeon]|nr:MAG: precorrin-2 C(20)-methyltransferase [Euryarchaeota archaeon]
MRMGRFYGVGVGPGDPELLTVKALRVLGEVDVICAPRTGDGKEGIALSIIGSALKKGCRVITPLFPMTRDEEVVRAHVQEAVDQVLAELERGRDVAFVTLGDPLFYSTYIYVLEGLGRVRGLEIETIPGVTSISACLAGLNKPLVGRGESLAILPAAYGLERLERLKEDADVIILLKVSRRFREIVDRLGELGLREDALFVSGCSTGEFRSAPLEEMAGQEVSYLSMIIIRRRR